MRNSDIDLACKFYKQLITEYPESHWAPAAKSEQEILNWLKANESSVKLGKYTGDPNSI